MHKTHTLHLKNFIMNTSTFRNMFCHWLISISAIIEFSTDRNGLNQIWPVFSLPIHFNRNFSVCLKTISGSKGDTTVAPLPPGMDSVILTYKILKKCSCVASWGFPNFFQQANLTNLSNLLNGVTIMIG